MVNQQTPLILLLVAIIALVNAVEKPGFLAFPKLPEFPAGLITSGAGFNPSDTQCRVRSKEHCQREFSKALGAPDTIFNSLNTLKKYLTTYYMEDKLEKGLLKLCVHRANYYRCIGPQYASCTDPFVIFAQAKQKSLPMNFFEAYELSQIHRLLDFDCLGGQVQATAHYDCVLQTWKSDKYQTGMQKCQDALKKADVTNFCLYAQVFLECVGSLFKTNACPTSELSWWECERNRVGFTIDGFCPKLTCNTVISVGSGDESPTVEATNQRGSFVSQKRLNLYKQFAKENPRRILSDAKLNMKK